MTPIPPLSIYRQGVDAAGFFWADNARRRGDRRAKVRDRKYPGVNRRKVERRSGGERRIRPGPGLPASDDLTRASSSLPDGMPVDRRRVPRCNELLLFPQDRERLWQQRRAALGCGTRYAAFRRFEDAGTFAIEHRMACRTSCGTRGCPRCMKARRERIGYRAMFSAGVFVTLTVSRDAWSCRDAWISAGEWVGALAQSIRRIVRQGRSDLVRLRVEAQEDALAAWTAGGIERRAPGGVQYAWVVEPHRSGWPHVHALFGLEWICVAWLRKEWRAIVGTDRANVDIQAVHDKAGACRYLSKYIAKSVLTLDILAVMHRRRIFATTIPVSTPRAALWSPEDETQSDEAFAQSRDPSTWGVNEGWRPDVSSHAGCALWSRPVRWESIAADLPSRRVLYDGPYLYDTVAQLPAALKRLVDPESFVGRLTDVRGTERAGTLAAVPQIPPLDPSPCTGLYEGPPVYFKPRTWSVRPRPADRRRGGFRSLKNRQRPGDGPSRFGRIAVNEPLTWTGLKSNPLSS